MTSNEHSKCSAIIHTASAASAAVGGGMAQIPGSDMIPITAAQVTMIISLGSVFGKSITETAAKALVKSLAGASVGRLASQLLVGWIPGLGNAINASTAAGITEALGWKAAKKFDRERG
ncbi:MAG: hypothetical protein IJP54_01640 [Synergistaceae bacterium]|nr:hypothetical protein [Synergistaceae bacterium]MBR0034353.1 hypothetical protein [Synergistaceae bacterium]